MRVSFTMPPAPPRCPVCGSVLGADQHGDREERQGDSLGDDARAHQLVAVLGVELAAAGHAADAGDRKSVVWGKSVSVRVDLGGRLLITNKKTQRTVRYQLYNQLLKIHHII